MPFDEPSSTQSTSTTGTTAPASAEAGGAVNPVPGGSTAPQGGMKAPTSPPAPADDPTGEQRFLDDLHAGKYGEYIKEGTKTDEGETPEGTPQTDTPDAEFDTKYQERYDADPLVVEAKAATEFLESIGSNLEAAKEAAVLGAALNRGDYETFSKGMAQPLIDFALNAPPEIIESTLQEAALIYAMRTGNFQAVPELQEQVRNGMKPEMAAEQAKRMADQKAMEAKLKKLEQKQTDMDNQALMRAHVDAVGQAYKGFLNAQKTADPEMYTEVESVFAKTVRADSTPISSFKTAEAVIAHWTNMWKAIEADVFRKRLSEGNIAPMDPLKTRTRTSVPDLPGGPIGSHPMDAVTDPKFGF